MEISEYAAVFDKTASPFYARASDSERVNCALLGLVSEVGEFLEAPSIDELGDVVWYHAKFSKSCGFDLKVVYDFAAQIKHPIKGGFANALSVHVSKVASYFKKSIEKGRSVKGEEVLSLAVEIAYLIQENAGFLGGLEEVMRGNFEKLQARHPHGFNPDAIQGAAADEDRARDIALDYSHQDGDPA